jgi:hypothetical protein
MGTRGGVRPNSGRKSNASKLLAAGFVAPWFTTGFQETKWKSFLESDDEKIVLDAMKYLTDRLFGKPAQSVDLNHSGEINVSLAERISQARKRNES